MHHTRRGFAAVAQGNPSARLSQAMIQAPPPQGTKARNPSKPITLRAYRLKLNSTKPANMSQPAACSQRDGSHTLSANPVKSKPSE